jgi:hypothetical protein
MPTKERYWRDPERGRAQSRDYHHRHRVEAAKAHHEYYILHRDEIKAQEKARRSTPGFKARRNARLHTWREANRDKVNIQNRAYYRRLRAKVINAYGGKCVCCSESRIEFLALDHKDGHGNENRRAMGRSGGGAPFYVWAMKNNFPDIFQILCHNCNFSRGAYGYCPHMTTWPGRS